MKRVTLKMLEKGGACSSALRWLEDCRDIDGMNSEEIYQACNNSEWLRWFSVCMLFYPVPEDKALRQNFTNLLQLWGNLDDKFPDCEPGKDWDWYYYGRMLAARCDAFRAHYPTLKSLLALTEEAE